MSSVRTDSREPNGRSECGVAGRTEFRDALYRKYLVAVETDGRIAHPAETRWADVRRDNAAAADGIITLRYGWSDVTERPCFVAAEVGAVHKRRGWPPYGRAGPAAHSASRYLRGTISLAKVTD